MGEIPLYRSFAQGAGNGRAAQLGGGPSYPEAGLSFSRRAYLQGYLAHKKPHPPRTLT
jgi:hypothetical protein